MSKSCSLLYNPKAGYENYTPASLVELLKRYGYEAKYQDPHGDGFKEVLHDPGEFVIIGGGDGTIGKIAPYLAGRNIPIGILPLGTANNIATSLNIHGEPEEIITRWDFQNIKAFDVGLFNHPKGEKLFLESVGFGLFPRLIEQRKNSDKEQSRQKELEDALKHQMEILKQFIPQACTIHMDGAIIQENCLMVEIMNIPFAGPNMCLAPDAKFDDGLLDIVIVREQDRNDFADFLSHHLEGGSCNTSPVKIHKARALRVEWQGVHYHIDDKAHEHMPPVAAHVHLLAQSLKFLLT